MTALNAGSEPIMQSLAVSLHGISHIEGMVATASVRFALHGSMPVDLVVR